MRLVSTLTLTALLATTGCSFVTQGEVNRVKDAIDSDEDGVPDALDCRPTNPAIFPGLCIDASSDLGVKKCPENPDNLLLPPIYDIPPAEEIVGDGIDNDCFGGDELDADGDTYPVMTEEDYLQRFGSTAPWPTQLRVRADCDDNDPTINPAASDEPYDGIDQNCGCFDENYINTDCNDFDQDGDGQIPPQYEAAARTFFAEFPALGLSGDEPDLFGDCDDSPDGFDTYRGAEGEVPYDGIDTDCSGDNDFDQDGDGYIYSFYRADYERFAHKFHPLGVPLEWAPDGELAPQDGDCMDVLPALYPLSVEPRLIHPNATDIVGDGIDSDCAGDNDYDADGDGFAPDSVFEQEILDYIDNWTNPGIIQNGEDHHPNTIVIPFEPLLGDCNDDKASVFPGQIESLLSDTDYDCDGNPTSSPFKFHTYLWQAPGHPRAVVTDQKFVLGTTARWLYSLSVGNSAELQLFPALTLRFDNRTATSTDKPIEQRWIYDSPPPPHLAAFDIVSDGAGYWIAAAFQAPPPNGDGSTRFSLVHQETIGSTFLWDAKISFPFSENPYPGIGVDLDLTIVDDALWIVSTGGAGRSLIGDTPDPNVNGVLRAAVFLRGDLLFNHVTTYDIGTNNGQSNFQRVNPTTGILEFIVCDDDGCDVFETNANNLFTDFVEPSSTSTFDNSYRETDTKNGMALLVRSGTGGFDVHDVDGTIYNFKSGSSLLSGDAVWTDTTGNGTVDTLFVAVVEEGTPANTIQFGWTSDPSIEPIWHQLDPNDTNPEHTHCAAGDTAPATCTEEGGRNLNPQRVELAATKHRLMVSYTGLSLDDIPLSPGSPPYGSVDDTDAPLQPTGGQDAFGWTFFSYYPDADGDGFPGDPDGLGQVSSNFLDPDDNDPNLPVPTP